MIVLNLLFCYIINISFIIIAQSNNCSSIDHTTIACNNQGEYYDSIRCFCTNCESRLINENICYNRQNLTSIYTLGQLNLCLNENLENVNCNVLYCGNLLTELDHNEKITGKLMCTRDTIDENNIVIEPSINESIKKTSEEFNFLAYFLITPDERNSTIDRSQSIKPREDYSDNYIRYYYHSCLKGFYSESCNYLANLCVLAMYNDNNFFCKMINNLNFPEQ